MTVSRVRPPNDPGAALSDHDLSRLARDACRQARRLGAGREDAEDIAQDVVTLLIAGHAVTDPWRWMTTVVRHGVFRLYRQTLKPQPLDEGGETFDHDPWGRREVWLDVCSALARLSPRARTALRMSLCGYSEREIADALKCSIKVVEKNLHKSRRRLRLLSHG